MSFKDRSTDIKNEIFQKKSKRDTLSDMKMIKSDKNINNIKCNEVCAIGPESKLDILTEKLSNDYDISQLNRNKKDVFRSTDIYRSKRNKVNSSEATNKLTKKVKNKQSKKHIERTAKVDNIEISDSNLLQFETELESLCPFKYESEICDKKNIFLALNEDTLDSKKVQNETIKCSESIEETGFKSNFNKNIIGDCLDTDKCYKKRCGNCKKYITFINNLLKTNRNK